MTQIITPEPKLSEWFGEFYGMNLSFQECEILTLQHIPNRLMTPEPELHKTRWFDYRRMHPMKATYLFAHFYNNAYGRAALIAQGKGGGFMKSFKGGDFLQAREKHQYWKLRQTVDKLGIRYDFFIGAAMDWHIANGWLMPPRPQHMNTNEEMAAVVVMRWEEYCAASIQPLKDTRYRVQNFFGHADQIEHERHVICQIGKRANPHFALHTALYVEQTVRVEEAIRAFGPDLVNKAVSFEILNQSLVTEQTQPTNKE